MPKRGDQSQSADSRLGQRIDNYTLLSVLGTGSTSIVYLAQRVDDPRSLVAVKILTFNAAMQSNDRASFRMRFLREARSVSKLRNEHILPVLSYGDSDDLSYMVMPVIVGGTLGVRLGQQHGPLPLPEIVDYLNQLADALDYAHGQGLVHRDVKPGNILLDEHRHLYLTDFGIARLFQSGENSLTREGPLTGTGQILGTPYYMAPEQITGDPVTPASDVYAAGVVLYQLVTGEVPFPGDTPLAVALQHLQEVPSSPQLLREELPGPVADVILRALAKKPADRYQSVGALAEAFSKTLANSATLAEPMASTDLWPFATTFGTATGLGTDASDDLDPDLLEMYDGLIGTRIGAYRIEHLRDASEHSARFVARREGSTSPFSLRILVPPPQLNKDEEKAFQVEADQRIQSLAALDHPHIEQVLDSGLHLGMPYVVSSAATGKSLADLLGASGAMEPQVIGNYLGQIVDALEYAHSQDVLHLNVTTAHIIVRGEGDLLVTDFALEPPSFSSDGANEGYTASDASAPEQLTGQPVGAYTDVYAVGTVLYQMLTAHPVFDGKSRDDVAQQHLNSTIPPARTWRSGLPAGIENVLARAMAKEPDYRFSTPNELVAAYNKVLTRSGASSSTNAAMTGGATRNRMTQAAMTSLPNGTNGHRASQSAPARSTVATTTSGLEAARSLSARTPTPSDSLSSATVSGLSRRRVDSQLASPMSATGTHIRRAPVTRAPATRAPAPPLLKGRINGRLRTEIIGVVSVVAIIALTIVAFNAFRSNSHPSNNPAAANGPSAEVRFFDGKNGAGGTDALSMTVTKLSAPPSGSTYNAWLVDDKGEHFLSLGTLTAADNGWKLNYDGSHDGGGVGQNLLGFGDRIEVTQEQGDVTAPLGKVVLTGAFPTTAFSHIRHLMVSFDTTPGQRGFLVGLLQQSTVLDQQAQVLLSFIQRQYDVSATCAAQSIIDIIEGKSGANYQQLSADCDSRNITEMGDGYGLIGSEGYLEGVSDHASLAAHSEDASDLIREHSQHVGIAITNATGWITTVEQDAQAVLGGNFDLAKAQELATLADRALHGVDTNGDESIDPIPGEAGVITAYTHGQLLALLDLTAPSTKK